MKIKHISFLLAVACNQRINLIDGEYRTVNLTSLHHIDDSGPEKVISRIELHSTNSMAHFSHRPCAFQEGAERCYIGSNL